MTASANGAPAISAASRSSRTFDEFVPTVRLRPILHAYLSTGGIREVAGINPRAFWVILDSGQERIEFGTAERILIAIGREDAWHGELADLYPERAGLHCEDCGKGPLDATDHRPLDLMRPEATATRWVWNKTTGRFVYRPKNARPGGRRFRQVDLCRRCAGLALMARGGSTIKENGKHRYLATSARVAPKRGGRPRLLSDAQLRQLHALYEHEQLSIGDLVRGLMAGGKVSGTRQGLYQSIMYGRRRLGLAKRPKGEAIRLAHARRGRVKRQPVRCPATSRKGAPCRLFVKIGRDYCVSHQHLERAAA